LKEIITGLDIGSTNVYAVIAERTEDKQLKIVGIGTAECEGLRFGMVVDIKKTA